MSNANLAARAARLFTRLKTPAQASKASSRVYALSLRTECVRASHALLDLSSALNEHRHALLCGFVADVAGASAHVAERDALALRASEVA